MIRALKQAGLAALVALGLFGAMVGLKMNPGPTHLVLRPQPVLVGVLVAAVFALRLLQVLWAGRSRSAAIAANRWTAEALTRAGRVVAPVLLLVAVGLPFMAGATTSISGSWC